MHARGSNLLLVAVLVLAAWANAFGQNGKASAGAGRSGVFDLSVTRLGDGKAPPVIDGHVDEDVWAGVPPFTEFTQQEPNEGQPATERTEVRVLLDRGTIYLSFICFDSRPDEIVVTQSRRDADLNETDSVQVVLDTFNDNQNAFVFGTNPLGIEYDGQVAGEGLTGGFVMRGGTAGSQRGGVSGFNANWDGDWRVRASRTERGWEAEMAIPLKTLRYRSGHDRTWGFNVMRNIRRKNEQVFLAPIPRGFSLYRVSLAAKLQGLDLPERRDVKVVPFAAARLNKDYTVATDPLDRTGDVGLDVKWGITPNMTADFTLNTDFAQVEADQEQINLTRFELFFPEKRGFFLENASMFQFGAPQQIDLFFSRRVGLSSTGVPIGIVGGGRLSGKAGGFNVGLLNMQTEEYVDPRTKRLVAPANNFSVARLQREVGRSNFGGIFVNREATTDPQGGAEYNRAFGLDSAIQVTSNGKLFSFIARTDSPGATGTDYAGRVVYTYANQYFNGHLAFAQVGRRFNPEVGFLPRRGYRMGEGRFFLTYQPKKYPWIRRFSPHITETRYYGFDGLLQTRRGHYHFFEIQPNQGGRFGMILDREQDQPLRDFAVYNGANGRRVVIAPGLYTWDQWTLEYFGNASARVYANVRYTWGGFYNGDIVKWQPTIGVRLFGARLIATASMNRDAVTLPAGEFVNTLVPVSIGYSFTPLASLQGLIQYNSQTAQLSSNIRLALLNRSGTGFFVVYNDRRDTTPYTTEEVLGRSFVVKYTRLFDF